ncbi:MAG: VPLPA-CTERM sorting domain-containing protein [Chromatiales bacterium]|nr:VPLPA-CTERM sorting domain-containing protein [Chromatiales bacterium]
MDHKQKSALAVAVAAGIGGMAATDVAQAAVYTATLTQVLTYSNNGTAGSAGNISSSTATFSYDDTTNLITQTGGLVNIRLTTAPTSTLYRASIAGLVMGNGAAATASSYVCTEGNFGAGVGASICGNYLLGANFLNESTTTWGPGTAASRTLGGDDIAAGPQQTISSLDNMTTISWVGTTLVLANKTCGGPCATLPAGAFNNGQQWTFTAGPQVVPVPAAVWLFGSALGLLGVARRRAMA